jgi:adenylate cyclase
MPLRHRSEALLLNILPQKIVDRMRGGEMIIADRILEATILFCDLVGFTAISQELPADRMSYAFCTGHTIQVHSTT